MRRRLLLVTLAVTSLLVAAFAVPLGLLVREVAHDRALTEAERDIAALAPVLAVTTTDQELLEAAIDRTAAGQDGRLAVWLADGTQLGDPTPDDGDDVALAGDQQVAFSRRIYGGVALYSPVVVGQDQVVVLRARVPDALREEGVATSWAILAVVAVVLLVVAVVATDRLARTVTRPAADLAATSRALAGGDRAARATAAGPPEIADVADAVNLLADRIDELRAAERERVADLSHRLRTPLTALRLDAEALGAQGLVADVDRLEAEITEVIRMARRPLHDEVVVRCDLAQVAHERVAFWGALADDDGRSWTWRVDPTGPHLVRTSAADAAATIDVLLGNVFAHTPEGSPYAVGVQSGHARVRLFVDDAGPGISDPALVLDRGISGSGSSGLGLDIAASTARAAGGNLVIGRSPAGGTRIELDLPRWRTSDDDS
ncbi:MAG: HAMP domain-containing sensor histidine kinase [Acidimicrobiales bacterium]